MNVSLTRTPPVAASLARRPARSALLGGLGLLVIALTLVLYFVALPARAAELQRLAPPAAAQFGQLAPEEARLLQSAGLPVSAYAFGVLGIESFALLAFAAVTGLTLWRRPGEPMLVFVALAAVLYAAFFTSPLDILLRAGPVWSTLSRTVQALGMWCAITFFYVFPTGRFEPRWAGLLAVACGAWVAAWVLVPGVPYAPVNPLDLKLEWFLAHEGWFLTGILAQASRFRREADPGRRQQTRWVLAALTVAVLGYAAVGLPALVWPPLQAAGAPRLVYHLAVLPLYEASLVLVPLSIVLSILRHRLWEMDVLINRALVYSVLTALLALVYLACVAALQPLLQVFTPSASPLVTALSTLATAVLFTPLRVRVQAAIDRRMYRRKYDAAQILTQFAAAARDETDLEQLVRLLAGIVGQTVQPEHVSVWIRPHQS